MVSVPVIDSGPCESHMNCNCVFHFICPAASTLSCFSETGGCHDIISICERFSR